MYNQNRPVVNPGSAEPYQGHGTLLGLGIIWEDVDQAAVRVKSVDNAWWNSTIASPTIGSSHASILVHGKASLAPARRSKIPRSRPAACPGLAPRGRYVDGF